MSKKFKTYIFKRIKNDNYRGYHLSQHNRLPFDKVSDILKTIYSNAKDTQFNIHVGDDKGVRQANCEIYYKIVECLNKNTGQTTINSLKKNIFPDLQVMGFLERYDSKNNIITSEKRSPVHSVKLTNSGIQYATESNPKEQYKMYINATEKILSPIIDDLFYLLYKEFDSISVWEFMFIFSDKEISLDEKIELIKQSRKMSNLQHIKLRKNIQEYFNKINRSANNKKEKRDFGNWYNETLQILNLLNQTVYFKTFRKTVLMLSLSQEALEFKAIRSESEKIKALQWHEISMKDNAYELHHIFPIEYATCNKDLDMIDNYRNLIYISKSAHDSIPRKNNLYVKLLYQNNEILLVNPFNEEEKINITNDVIIKEENIYEMIKHNLSLLNNSILDN